MKATLEEGGDRSAILLFIVIEPKNPYFASRHRLEVKPLEVYPLGPRSSSCGPTKGPPLLGDTLRAN